MASAAWVILLISIFATSQGLLEQEKALLMLEELEAQVQEQISGVQRLLRDGQRALLEETEKQRSLVLARVYQDTQDIVEEAEERGCSKIVIDQIINLQYSFEDRWVECMNLTERAVDFERWGLDVYQDFIQYTPVFCDAINNVTLCTGNKWVQMTECILGGVEAYLTKFQDMSTELVNVVERVNDIVQKATNDAKGCFGSQARNLRIKQEALQLAKAWNVWNNNKCHGQYKQLEIDSREKEAITSCKIFGRCQILDLEETNTYLFLDGAHTVESLRVAKEWFLASAGSSKRLLIFNITGPRSAVTLLKELQNCGFSEAIFCTNCISETSEGFLDLIKERESLDSEYTKVKDNLQSWSTLYPDIPGSAVKTVEEALRQAESSKESKSVLITGSLHLVGSVLAFMSKRQQ